MKARFKAALQAVPWTFGIVKFVYSLCRTVSSMRLSYWRFVAESFVHYVAQRGVIIVYCEVPSHLGNVDNIPNLLAERFGKHSKVWLVCGFIRGPELEPYKTEGIKCLCEIPEYAIGLFAARAFISPTDRETRWTCPLFARTVYVMHALVDTDGVFPEHSFDAYRYICCAGPHQVADLKALFTRRAISGKVLIPVGYPKLDRQLRTYCSPLADSAVEVIYAPTLINNLNESLASLRKFGMQIVTLLCRRGKMIFRPHPLSFRDNSDSALIEEIVRCHEADLNFELDRSSDYSTSYSRSQVMVTDLSGTGFTYAFSCERPVIFFAHNALGEKDLKGIQYQSRDKIGEVARNLTELEGKLDLIRDNYQDYRRRLVEFRSRAVFNVGSSADTFVEEFASIIDGRTNPNWVMT